MSAIWIAWMVLNLVETAATLLVMTHIAKKSRSDDLKAALDLLHQVANDAMMHLKAQTPLQVVEAKAAEKQAELSAKEAEWLAERQKRDMLAEESRRENLPKRFMKDVDGVEHDLSDFEPMG